MKIVSWNVNGLARCRRNGFLKFLSDAMHIPDREPRLHGVLAPPCRKGAPLFHEQF